MKKSLKNLFKEEEAMTIIGSCLGFLPGLSCPCCCCCGLTSCIGGLMGLQADMRYISALVARWIDLAFAPFYR
ncbi:MAG: hypothetical protein EF806_05415 [Candidatus Methanoliparum thermophilum]|uniref:Uncharacterized protein n=1 Tax=Methanoliparum thermophilum TaxID=2491083 RepID=A0A520KR26_METT2|nr:hypothetical protein [Candidatus Methanoliparum sp. LAM-1]RZN64060.1 MAG: hypothetical protein EF806_05415 [Candidatus Methanoliparum thermophilum]BDC35685.1 hypothetical protein MTLP_03670 [Candidatus Methanoliparum sp. LAM-1]